MKIVVPIMPTSLEEAQALELSRFEGADIIEWRADFLDKDSILTVAPAIFEKFAGFEIIFTIRTTREGGRLELTDAEYVALIIWMARGSSMALRLMPLIAPII